MVQEERALTALAQVVQGHTQSCASSGNSASALSKENDAVWRLPRAACMHCVLIIINDCMVL